MFRRTAALLCLLLTTGPVGAFAQAPAAAPRPVPPPCRDVAACRLQLEAGHYSPARAGLEALRRGSTRDAASLTLARLDLAEGRYESAVNLARPLSARGSLRAEAATTLGEALAAQGQLDQAQAAFESVASERTAHRARVLLGRLLLERGREAEATTHLMALVQAYNEETITARDAEGLAYVAMAAQMLDSPHDANDAYQESTRVDGRRVETQLEWAELFLSRYDTGNAAQSIRAALAVNPEHPRAHALMARLHLIDAMNFQEANASLERAAAVNPHLVMAHVTRAEIAIREMDLPEADAHIGRALAVNPNDLEALSVRAAIRFLEDDQRAYRAATRDVLRRNPRFSGMYSIIAEYANWEHRYPQIVEMAREALRLNPEDAAAHATLGINLLRMGEEEAGLDALREAWRRDRFNVRVYNTLNLFDDVLSREYESIESAPFVFRLHREERPVMEPLLTDVLGRAYRDMRRRYAFTPDGPIHIELFSTVEHFSVRTSGLPRIGVQGVCFGKLVTAMSPRAGPFNWAQITWHELAHVFHIQLSDNHVPRWFTEGLAEYETILARPEWRREEDHRLARYLESGRLPALRQLNHAFTHAESGEDVMVAYYASSMLVKYIAERFGFPRVVRMLREWGAHRSDEQVIQRALGIDIDTLDRDFRAATAERFRGRPADYSVDFAQYRDLEARQAAAQAAPQDAAAQAALAAAQLVAGDAEASTASMRRALRLDRDQPLARYTAARLAMARRDGRTARADLRLLIESGHDGYDVRLAQARVALSTRAPRLARAALEAASRIDPERHEAWQGLLSIAEQAEDALLRDRVLQRLVDVDQHDREASAALLSRLSEREAWAELLTYGERALYVDPMNPLTHAHYGEALLRAGRHAAALRHADAALGLRPEEPAAVHRLRARSLRALGRVADAREAERAAGGPAAGPERSSPRTAPR